MKRISSMCAALLIFAGAPGATAGGSKNVEAHLISSANAVRAGDSLTVAVALKVAPGWHIYWKNPGDSGVKTSLVFTLPDFFRASDLRWPIPQRFIEGGLMMLGYTGEVVLLATITAAAEVPKGRFSIMAQVKWVECRDICIPGRADLSLALPSTPEPVRPDPSQTRFFAEARRRLPSADPAVRARYIRTGDAIEITLRRVGGLVEPVDFLPEAQGWIDLRSPPRITRSAAGFTLRFKRPADPLPAGDLKGVLVMGSGVGRKGFEISAAPADVKAH